MTDIKQRIEETAGDLLKRLGTDGMLWAEEMHKRFPAIPQDVLHGWCCNMIMVGYDAGRCLEQNAFEMARLIKDQQARIAELEASKNNAYWERNQLVAALTKIFPAWIERHPESDTTWDHDWRNIIFINLPTGQASWHIHDSEFNDFQHLPQSAIGIQSWDGHTTEEKYKRLANIQPTNVRA